MSARATRLPRLIDATTIAEVLGCHRVTAWRRLKAGEFGQPIDIGTGGDRAQWRITEGQLQEWLQSRTAA